MTSQTTPAVTIERVYDHPAPEPGVFRVFVDRLWPRGVRKDQFHYDEWAKDLAPSADLRRWYSHDVARFSEFRARYVAELSSDEGREALSRVAALASGRPVVLLTATHDVEHSQAHVLADVLGDTL